MREIKFRVWFPNQGRYMRREEAIDNLMDVTCGKLVFDIDEHNDESESKVEYFTDGSYVLMQFTGLKDKNGVEIYEGDIVRGRYADEYYTYFIKNERVVFKNGCFGLLDNNDFFTTLDYYLEEQSKFEIKVIGNIYEHPHLLSDYGGNR